MSKVVVVDSTGGVRYEWPHHTNDLILDRKDSEGSEIFMTYIAPGEACHRHAHADNEQIYYIVSGRGRISYRESAESVDQTVEVRANRIVFIPRNTEHEVRCVGDETLTYLCVDVFPHGKPADEPTWAAHAEALKRDTAEKP